MTVNPSYAGCIVKMLVSFGYHDQTSPRHHTVVRHFKKEGWNVVECHTDKTGLLAKYRDLVRQWKIIRNRADAILVPFPGHLLMPLAWLLTRRSRKPLFFDAFLSQSDSTVTDRGLVSWRHPYAWLLFALDWLGTHLADDVFVDTLEHRAFFLRRFRLKPARVGVIYLAAREDLFFPASSPKDTSDVFRVLFYGSYIPLQGIEHILRAAAIVGRKTDAVRFTLIGSGQLSASMHTLAQELKLSNVTFVPTVPLAELADRIRCADLCLGIFGTTAKAQRVIPHKVCDAVACGIPVLTEDSPAIRERFAGHPLVSLCPAGNPDAIASFILSRSTSITHA